MSPRQRPVKLSSYCCPVALSNVVSTPQSFAGKDLKRSKYRLLGLVGQGQFGRVYCAVHRRTGQLVALKELDHERFPTHKFLRELRFLLSLEHPNIVTCRSLEHTHTGRYLVMDYCEGGTLRGLMEEDVRLSLPQCVRLTMDILVGLEHAHNRGIVHCDIKPENILLNLEPHGWRGRVSDFGIARVSQEVAEPQSGSGNTGSPAYMAPERFYGQYSKSSDLYSVGILLFELMSGDRPFSGTPGELMAAHLNKGLAFPDSIDPVWHPVLTGALQKLAARRFHSAAEMLQSLKQAAEQAGILSYLEKQPISMPLLNPVGEVPLGDLQACRTERIGHPIGAIAPWPDSDPKLLKPFPAVVQLGYGLGDQVVIGEWRTQRDDNSPDPLRIHPMPVQGTVQHIIPNAHGCYVVTSEALYRLTQLQGQLPQPSQILHWEAPATVTLAPDHRWMAIAHIPPDQDTWQLQIYSLTEPVAALLTPKQNRHISLPHPNTTLVNAIALDQRHLVTFLQAPAADDTTQTNTWLDLVTRHGTFLTRLPVPVQIDQIHSTPIPYRLVASDRNDPQSLIVLDLKPYRIERLALGLIPHHVLATAWGYVVADASGKVLILDEFGQRVGQLELPFTPTAMAVFPPSGLVIATWNETWGHLHLIDLKTLNIDLLF